MRLILVMALLALAAPVRAQDAPPEPEFTPFTVAPVLTNREEVVRALVREYPDRLRDEGIGGRVNVWFHITADGRAQYQQINESSGVDALDQAALRVAEVFEFRPAMNREQRVAVWISLPITFESQGRSDRT